MLNKIQGSSNVAIIVLTLCTVVFSGSAVHFYLKAGDSQKNLNDLLNSTRTKDSLLNLSKDLESTKQVLQKVSNLVGFFGTTSASKEFKTDPQVIINKLDFLSGEENGLGLNLPAKKIEEDNLFNPTYVQEVTKLEVAWEKGCKKVEDLQKQLEETQGRLKEEQNLYAQETQNTLNEIGRLENLIKEKRKKLDESRKENEENLQKEEAERKLAQDSRLQEKEKLADLVRKKRQEKQKGESELENLDERTNELKAEAEGQSGIERWFQEQQTVQKVQESPDGQIIYVDQKSQTAYIDLGVSTGILKGIPFQVFRYGKGGVKDYKGKVVVKQVQDNISIVGIVETTNPLDPIITGDKIINPVYEKDKVRYFVIAGRLEKYSLEQARRLVERLGGKIESEVSAKTDFVVLGEGFKKDPAYQIALDRGIETMLESEFLGYIGD